MPRPEPARRRVEAASVPVLQRVGRVPRLLVALVVGGGVLTAFIVGNRWAALALVPALAFLAWLTYLAWPRLTPPGRALRLLVLGVLTAWAVSRLVVG